VSTAAAVIFWLAFSVFSYHWVVFPCLLWFLAARRRRRGGLRSSSSLPQVVIAVAAYNEEKVIAAKIVNCLSMDWPADRLGVVVASDGSDDATDTIVSSFTDPRVRLIRLERRSGKPAALNRLIAEADGDAILFTDADVTLAPDALRVMAGRLVEPGVGAVHAHYFRVNDQGSPAEGLFDRYESVLKNLEGQLGAMVGAYGWALLVRKQLCEPMPEDTILDDFLIGVRPFRAGFSVVYEKGARCWTRVETEEIEFGRKVRISQGNVQALLRNADLFAPRYGLKAWVLFSHKFLRWIMPFLMLLMLACSVVQIGNPFFLWVSLVLLAACVSTPLVLVVPRKARKLMVLQYYILQNVALVVGYWQYIARPRQSYWKRTNRD